MATCQEQFSLNASRSQKSLNQESKSETPSADAGPSSTEPNTAKPHTPQPSSAEPSSTEPGSTDANATAASPAQANGTFSGVTVPGVGRVAFPPPALSGLEAPADGQQERLTILKRVSGPVDWERFSRDSLAAPVLNDIDALNDAEGTRVGYKVYSAFIAYADLNLLKDRDLMEATFGEEVEIEQSPSVEFEGAEVAQATKPAFRKLTDEAREAVLGTSQGPASSLAWVRLPLFNQVVIRGVVSLRQLENETSVQMQWRMQPQPTESELSDSRNPNRVQPSESIENPSRPNVRRETYRNTWVKLQPNELGRMEQSEPQPYSGLGGYTAVTSTGLEPRQLLVETCLVIHEPSEWFGGSQFLRARLLVSMQESAKTFRRKLLKLGDRP